MDIGVPLIEHGSVDISKLLLAMSRQTTDFWECDRPSRVKLAGDRPGNAVFHYNDQPPCISRICLEEAKTGRISVLRRSDRPLFKEVQEVIETNIAPVYADCDIMRVQLAELPPGQVIALHRDLGILSQIHRLHVPLVTHPGVKFIVGGQSFHLQPAKLYELNNVAVHGVENNSEVMRVHLMVDMAPRSLARMQYYNTEDEMVAAIERFKAEWRGLQNHTNSLS